MSVEFGVEVKGDRGYRTLRESCQVCSWDRVREIFKVAVHRKGLRLMGRCEECGHQWQVTFAGNTEWLFLGLLTPPEQQTRMGSQVHRAGIDGPAGWRRAGRVQELFPSPRLGHGRQRVGT